MPPAGTRTVFDNVVVDGKTGGVKILNETKTGNATFTPQQLRFWEKGESVTLTGKNATSVIGQTVNASTTATRVTRIADLGKLAGGAY